MADLAASAVTITGNHAIPDKSGRKIYSEIEATVVLSGQGSTSNKVLASAFGLASIKKVEPVVTDSNTIYPAAPSYDGTYILIADAANATATNHVNGADLTDTVKMVVYGNY